MSAAVSPYDFDECDEMTLCALGTAKDLRDRLADAYGTKDLYGIDRTVPVVSVLRFIDTYAQEIVDSAQWEEGDEDDPAT